MQGLHSGRPLVHAELSLRFAYVFVIYLGDLPVSVSLCVCYGSSLSIPISSRPDSESVRVPGGEQTAEQPRTEILFLLLSEASGAMCYSPIHIIGQGVHLRMARGEMGGTVAGQRDAGR